MFHFVAFCNFEACECMTSRIAYIICFQLFLKGKQSLSIGWKMHEKKKKTLKRKIITWKPWNVETICTVKKFRNSRIKIANIC